MERARTVLTTVVMRIHLPTFTGEHRSEREERKREARTDAVR
jgi:hypothetical protein